MTRTTLMLIAVLLAGCTAASPTATPVPTVTPAPTASPTAEPTPRIVEVEVAVVPEACFAALESARQMMTTDLDFRIALLDAYLDFPDENLAEFGKRVEDLLNSLGDGAASTDLFAEYQAELDECYAKSGGM